MNNNHQLAKVDRYTNLAQFAGHSFHCTILEVTQNMASQDEVVLEHIISYHRATGGDNVQRRNA